MFVGGTGKARVLEDGEVRCFLEPCLLWESFPSGCSTERWSAGSL